jgi:Protein of unknown function (DUF1757)
MSLTWFKNMAGLTLTDEEMRDIPRPYTELTVHVTEKCIQAFGLLGTCVVGPLSAVARASTRNAAGLGSQALKCGKWGVVVGVVAGPLMTYSRLKSANADVDSVYDRCYRLRLNRGQVRVDQAATVGALGGVISAVPLGGSPLFGALLGMSGGIVAMAVYNNSGASSKKPSE